MNSTAKKQNRILLVALVVILSAAAILIAVTGSANKKGETVAEAANEWYSTWEYKDTYNNVLPR